MHASKFRRAGSALLLFIVSSEGLSAAAYVPKIAPLVPFKAEPFAFDEVQLLNGYLKHAQDLNADDLLSLDVNRLVARFRQEAGLPRMADAYPGWESVQLPGVACGFFLSGSSMLYASTKDTRFLDRIERVLYLLDECQHAHGDGYLLATRNGKRIFGEIEKGDLRLTEGWKVNGEPEPYYALEKLMSGLRDAYRIAGCQQALDIEIRLGNWIEHHMSMLSDELLQRIMSFEYGGMNWVLSDLYVDTGDPKFQKLSQRWWDKAIYDPLSRHEDILPGKHANTQFPKICGLAASYPYTANSNELRAAEFFWDRVVRMQTYVTGGNSMDEHFGPAGKLNDRLAGNTTESCNSFNMLRLTRMLFCLDPRPEQAEYFERVLFNHVLAHQNPENGRVCYFLPLDAGRNKVFDSAYDSFSCCVCSAMESHARHMSFLYMHDEQGLYVNLFAPSELHWKNRGLTLRQETRFPDDGSVNLSFTCDKPTTMTLKLRNPTWSPKTIVKVNTQTVEAGPPGEYVMIRREWKTGDQVAMALSMPLRTESMPDNPKRIALFRGPILLAADLGPDTQPRPKKSELPMILFQPTPVESWLEPLPSKLLEYRTTPGVLSESNLEVRPFFKIYGRRYIVYWDVGTAKEAEGRRQISSLQDRFTSAIEARTVDFVNVAENQSESAHHLQFESSNTGRRSDNRARWRDARGWFSYDLNVKADRPMELICTWWGSDEGRVFDILVDGTRIAVVQHDRLFPEQLFTMTYPIPVDLTAGKDRVTIKFAPHARSIAGGLMNVLRVAEIK